MPSTSTWSRWTHSASAVCPPRTSVSWRPSSRRCGRTIPARGAPPPPPSPSPPAERFRAHRAVRDVLERLAAAQPVVLILDDLHWADEATVELVAYLMRH